ncbi:ABC transporter ATP-binding protein [Miniphocaeibacter halophilus]|uniref:ABC transporter ATP-binding protein n=1 Tax=Miniphocaeibacter halophilus TaxID=2931922 RepID=A0AC61MT96_9FIRM|nr:ABC transporter ATP-binding protein [Miniphocaeibacter halophilus]QQK08847.1 ABC transporter ATP-binding protein [Miniphocaeibacter halophilus]
MLDVIGLSKKYNKTLAVDNVSFDIQNGTVGVLIGPNGSGKSTIIKSVAGLLRYTGEIKINNLPNKDIEAKKVFGYIPEIPAMFPLLTVREHIVYILKAYGLEIDNEKIDSLLKRFDLTDKQDKLGDELSKGMMQKVSICCALAVEPEVIMLDEPMVGLDPKAIKELKIIIKELKEKNCTILISTHMLEMVEDVWDMMILMKEGRKVGQYYKNQMGDKDLEELFFELTGEEDE